MWKDTKLFELKNNRFARTSGWINNDRIEFIFWIISLSPWRAMCMSTVTVLWIPMHLQIFTHTHTHTHVLCVSGWVGAFDKVNFTHRVNDEWLHWEPTVKVKLGERILSLSVSLLPPLPLSFSFMFIKLEVTLSTGYGITATFFKSLNAKQARSVFFVQEKSLTPIHSHDAYTVIKKFTRRINVGSKGHLKKCCRIVLNVTKLSLF